MMLHDQLFLILSECEHLVSNVERQGQFIFHRVMTLDSRRALLGSFLTIEDNYLCY